jgi:hypothetical protein
MHSALNFHGKPVTFKEEVEPPHARRSELVLTKRKVERVKSCLAVQPELLFARR